MRVKWRQLAADLKTVLLKHFKPVACLPPGPLLEVLYEAK
jgi:hypothetical protein